MNLFAMYYWSTENDEIAVSSVNSLKLYTKTIKINIQSKIVCHKNKNNIRHQINLDSNWFVIHMNSRWGSLLKFSNSIYIYIYFVWYMSLVFTWRSLWLSLFHLLTYFRQNTNTNTKTKHFILVWVHVLGTIFAFKKVGWFDDVVFLNLVWTLLFWLIFVLTSLRVDAAYCFSLHTDSKPCPTLSEITESVNSLRCDICSFSRNITPRRVVWTYISDFIVLIM